MKNGCFIDAHIDEKDCVTAVKDDRD